VLPVAAGPRGFEPYPTHNPSANGVRALRARRGRQIALDVVRGLHHMHSRKVMHLDLKSANILLARDGTAKIADVGLAKILTRDNTCVSTEGTFDWAAPEARAAPPVARSRAWRGREVFAPGGGAERPQSR